MRLGKRHAFWSTGERLNREIRVVCIQGRKLGLVSKDKYLMADFSYVCDFGLILYSFLGSLLPAAIVHSILTYPDQCTA